MAGLPLRLLWFELKVFGRRRMIEDPNWRTVYDFWFPPDLDEADAEAHSRMFLWWFGGGANAKLPRFGPVLEAARAGRLDHWLAAPLGRLALIVVLDQFPRGLFAGTPAGLRFRS